MKLDAERTSEAFAERIQVVCSSNASFARRFGNRAISLSLQRATLHQDLGYDLVNAVYLHTYENLRERVSTTTTMPLGERGKRGGGAPIAGVAAVNESGGAAGRGEHGGDEVDGLMT